MKYVDKLECGFFPFSITYNEVTAIRIILSACSLKASTSTLK